MNADRHAWPAVLAYRHALEDAVEANTVYQASDKTHADRLKRDSATGWLARTEEKADGEARYAGPLPRMHYNKTKADHMALIDQAATRQPAPEPAAPDPAPIVELGVTLHQITASE